jgi:sulfonate transport system permease protein
MRENVLRAHVDPRAFIVPIALVALWAIASSLHLVDPHVIVPPATVAATLMQMLGGADYWTAVGSSLARVCGGFVIGGAGGLLVGVVLGVSRIAERIGAPTLHGARSVALFAWIPLLTAWFGDGEIPKVALIALAAFFPVALNTERGCRQVPAALLEVGRVLEFDRWTTVRRIVLPAASRSIITGLQLGLTTAWIGTIGAEYLIDQGTGIGIALSSARIDNRMDMILIYMLTLALMGLALNLVVRRNVVDD